MPPLSRCFAAPSAGRWGPPTRCALRAAVPPSCLSGARASLRRRTVELSLLSIVVAPVAAAAANDAAAAAEEEVELLDAAGNMISGGGRSDRPEASLPVAEASQASEAATEADSGSDSESDSDSSSSSSSSSDEEVEGMERRRAATRRRVQPFEPLAADAEAERRVAKERLKGEEREAKAARKAGKAARKLERRRRQHGRRQHRLRQASTRLPSWPPPPAAAGATGETEGEGGKPLSWLLGQLLH